MCVEGGEEWAEIRTVFLGKHEEKRPLQRPTIKCLKGIRWGDADCIHLVQDWGKWRAVVNTVMNLRVPQNVWNFFTN